MPDTFYQNQNNEQRQRQSLENSAHIDHRDRRGFASMDREKQREIARKGGIAAHQSGHAHRWTSEEAKEAGRKGGLRRSENMRGRER